MAVKPLPLPPPTEPDSYEPDSLETQGLVPEFPDSTTRPALTGEQDSFHRKQKIIPKLIVSFIVVLMLAPVFFLFFLLIRLIGSPIRTIIDAAEKVSRLSRNDPYQGITKTVRPAPLKRKMNSLFNNVEKDDKNLYFEGPPLLSLFVTDQNTKTGRRNLHTIKRGYSLSLGGGDSDFLIFLVPVPARIASIHFDGKHCSFIPRKRRFFPDLGSRVLPNCIEKPIKVVSGKKYELKIYIERYEDPLKTLNRLLRSVYIP